MSHLFAHRTLVNLPGTIDEIADNINDANNEITLCYSNNPNHSPKVWLEAPTCYTDPIYETHIDEATDLLDQMLGELRE